MLLIELKESLEREMRSGFAAINIRFDTQAARLDRQITELRKRIEDLEKK